MNIREKSFLVIVAGLLLAAAGLAWVYSSAPLQQLSHETGTIGDTIGGIAGPILSLCGMILVFFSLEEQRASNDSQNRLLTRKILADERKDSIREVKRAVASAQEEIKAQVVNLRAWHDKASAYYIVGPLEFRRAGLAAPPYSDGELDQLRRKLAELEDGFVQMITLLEIAGRKLEHARLTATSRLPDCDKEYLIKRFYDRCLNPVAQTHIMAITEANWQRMSPTIQALALTLGNSLKRRQLFYSDYKDDMITVMEAGPDVR